MPELTFITSHPLKATELSRHLNYPITHHRLSLSEIQSLDPIEITRAKTMEAFRILQRPVLVEDFSISFAALGHLPGPLIKWFLQELKVEGLCKLLDAYDTREAIAQTTFGLCETGEVLTFSGRMEGKIARQPQGDNGYGTDAIFIPHGISKTWGEMNTEEQITWSLRRIGLAKLEAHLHQHSS